MIPMIVWTRFGIKDSHGHHNWSESLESKISYTNYEYAFDS
jgi:hypothetical protein